MTKSVFNRGFGDDDQVRRMTSHLAALSPALGPGSCDHINRFVLWFLPRVYKMIQWALISELQHKLNQSVSPTDFSD